MRLVDLHCDWLRQYATETTQYDPSLYPEIPGRVERLDGYLLGTALAVLGCSRKPEDWERQSDPWNALGMLIARAEAEFAGRLLCEPADVARWRSSPAEGLCWGVLGVAGFDVLVRQQNDLDRLGALFDRGVRVFQPIAAQGGDLGGSATSGDDPGLTDLGRTFLDRLAGRTPPRPRPILDLAGMGPRTIADALQWLDRQPPSARPLIAVTHGLAGSESLREIRLRGGVVGLTPGRPGCETADDLKRLIDAIAAMPFAGRDGYEGIAISSDLLDVDRPPAELRNAREIVRWLRRAFDRNVADAIAAGTATSLLLQSVGDPASTDGPEAGIAP